jgi:hypothetical protein
VEGRLGRRCQREYLLLLWYLLRGIDTLGVEFVVPRFTIYQVLCERLETIHHVTHASECFGQMVDELAQEIQGKGKHGFSVSDRAYEAGGIYVTILCQNLNLIATRN